jgi:hypothetical protein
VDLCDGEMLVLFEVRTEFLNIIYTSFGFKKLMTFSALCSATVMNCGTDDKMTTNKLILHLIYSTSILALLYYSYFQTMLPAIPTISSLNKCGIMI